MFSAGNRRFDVVTQTPQPSYGRLVLVRFVAIALVSFVVGGAAVTFAQGPETKTDAVRASYVLGPDDQVVIRVLDMPDLSDKPQRIDPNGDLRMPVVGRVRAAGLTAEQLEAELANRLKALLQQPDVSVSVAEFRSQPVSVLGAVATPGIKQLEGSKTKALIEVLSMAGGPSAEAGPTVRVTRRSEQGRIPLPEAVDQPGFSVVDIPLKPLMDAMTPDKNIAVHPTDVVSIPRADV